MTHEELKELQEWRRQFTDEHGAPLSPKEARTCYDLAESRLADMIEPASWVCRLFGTEHPKGRQELKDYVQQLRAAVSRARGMQP